jgi:hypothetical protein
MPLAFVLELYLTKLICFIFYKMICNDAFASGIIKGGGVDSCVVCVAGEASKSAF